MCFFNKTSQTRRQVSSGHFWNTTICWRHGTEKCNQYNYDKKSTTGDAARQCPCCGERPKLYGKIWHQNPFKQIKKCFFLKRCFFKHKVYKNKLCQHYSFQFCIKIIHPSDATETNFLSHAHTYSACCFFYSEIEYPTVIAAYMQLGAYSNCCNIEQSALRNFPPFLLHLCSHVAPVVYQLFPTHFP